MEELNIKEIDNFIAEFNALKMNTYLCRYALNPEYVIAITQFNNKLEVFPFKLILKKDIYLVIQTMKQYDDNYNNYHNARLMAHLANQFSNAEINSLKLGTPDNNYSEMNGSNIFQSLSNYQWFISEKDLIEKNKKIKA